jgi:hypothetical protein
LQCFLVPESDEVVIQVKVTRYDIQRLRLLQVLVPLAFIVTTLARRTDSLPLYVMTAILQGGAIVAWLSATKRLGWQALELKGGGVKFGSTAFGLRREQVRNWTMINRVARLYSSKVSYRVLALGGSEQVVRSILQSQFGQPVALQRRGSVGARMLAVGAALCGLVVVALAIIYERSLLAIAGVPLLLGGFAVFGALSQRAARR